MNSRNSKTSRTVVTAAVLLFGMNSLASAGATVCTFVSKATNAGYPVGTVQVPTCSGSVVVTTAEDVASATASLKTELQNATATQISDVENNIKATLKTAVDQLPQRLLTDTAKEQIMNALRAEFRSQLDALRDELQARIDAVATPRNSLPRTTR